MTRWTLGLRVLHRPTCHLIQHWHSERCPVRCRPPSASQMANVNDEYGSTNVSHARPWSTRRFARLFGRICNRLEDHDQRWPNNFCGGCICCAQRSWKSRHLVTNHPLRQAIVFALGTRDSHLRALHCRRYLAPRTDLTRSVLSPDELQCRWDSTVDGASNGERSVCTCTHCIRGRWTP